jgi:hypothetical protein
MRSGCLWEVVAFGRWSLMGNGCFFLRWPLMESGRLQEMVAYEGGSHKR